MKHIGFLTFTFTVGLVLILTSCKKQNSATTGWEYNNPKNGGFSVTDFAGQLTGPGLVLIQGGSFTMGANYDDPMYDWDNIPRKVTLKTFYLDFSLRISVIILKITYISS